jgi:hypothetical protein
MRGIHPVWTKIVAQQYTQTFEKVMLLDIDVFVTDEAADIFAMHKPGHVLGYDESGDFNTRLMHLVNYGAYFSTMLTPTVYLNAGVIVFDKDSQAILDLPPTFGDDGFREQDWINFQIAKHDIPVQKLSGDYNCMPHLWTPNLPESAKFIHLATIRDIEPYKQLASGNRHLKVITPHEKE